MKSYRSVFLSVLSATLLVFSFPTANFWCLAWIALVPFFLAIQDKNFANTFLLGLLAGLVFFYGAIHWLNSIAVAGTIVLVFYLAFYFALFALAVRLAARVNLTVASKAVLVASAWVVFEFIRANFLTGFGWVLLGYSQSSFLPAIQIADITGAWGVSFLVVFVNVVIYEFFIMAGRAEHRPGLVHNRLLNLVFCLILVLGVFIYGFYKLNSQLPTPNSQLKISLIQGNILQPLKWDYSFRSEIIEKYFNLTKAAATDEPDLIIWPETSFPADFNSEPELADNLFQLAKATNAYLLVGSNRFEGEEIYNSAFLIGPDGEVKACYDKLRLVPFGEYIPNIPKFLYKILPEKINMVGDFSCGKEYTVFRLQEGATVNELPLTHTLSPKGRGIKGEGARNDGEVTLSVLICFEDIFPELARRFVKNGARLLVNITNDGWYGPSSAAFQHAQASVLRAVENRVPVVRAGNTGVSIFIDEKGRVVDGVRDSDDKEIFITGYRTAVVSVAAHPPATFYNRWGEVFISICLLIFLASLAIILSCQPTKLERTSVKSLVK